jgi:hypothetical protein
MVRWGVEGLSAQVRLAVSDWEPLQEVAWKAAPLKAEVLLFGEVEQVPRGVHR